MQRTKFQQGTLFIQTESDESVDTDLMMLYETANKLLGLSYRLRRSVLMRLDEIDEVLKIELKRKEKLIKEKKPFIKKTKFCKGKKEKIKALIPNINTPWDQLTWDWLEYKYDRGEMYKSIQGVHAFQTRLKKLSNNNLQTAAQILEQSYSNNWASVWAVKENNGKSKSGIKPPKIMDGGEWYYLNEDGEYYTKSGKLYYD